MAAVLKIQYDRHFCTFSCSTVVFPDPEDIWLESKISTIYHQEAEILIEIRLCIAAILKSNMAAIHCFLAGTIVFLDLENISLDTKISIVCYL